VAPGNRGGSGAYPSSAAPVEVAVAGGDGDDRGGGGAPVAGEGGGKVLQLEEGKGMVRRGPSEEEKAVQRELTKGGSPAAAAA
jgi:hypothetical protein